MARIDFCPRSRFFCFLGAALLTLPLLAGAQIYTWKDENGRTIMSDKPPLGKAAQKKAITPATGDTQPSAQTPKTFAEKEMEFRKEQQDRQDKAKKAEAEQAQAAQRKENCDNARRNLQTYQSGERVARRTDSGEREILDDDQRAAEAAKAQKAVNEWCK